MNSQSTIDTITISLNDIEPNMEDTQTEFDFSDVGPITISGTEPISLSNMNSTSYPSIGNLSGGYIYTTNGTTNSWDTIAVGSDYTNRTLQVSGDANFDGDVKIQGKSIVESLEKIEEKLAILHPNEELEEKWEQLRGLRQAYMDLEKEIIEKEKMWEILKK